MGAIWGEDPRYLRDGSTVPFKSRLGHVALWTVEAPNRNGELRPAYARFIGISSSSFIFKFALAQHGGCTDVNTRSFAGRIGFGPAWPDGRAMHSTSSGRTQSESSFTAARANESANVHAANQPCSIFPELLIPPGEVVERGTSVRDHSLMGELNRLHVRAFLRSTAG